MNISFDNIFFTDILLSMPEDRFKKDLFRGSQDAMILAVLTDGRQYGYAMQKRLKEVGGQTMQAGTLYPLLHRLEKDGLITATWDKSTGRERKWYALTPAGRQRLKRHAADWQAYIARLQSLILPALRNLATQRS